MSVLDHSPVQNIVEDYLLDLRLDAKSSLTASTYKGRLKTFCRFLAAKNLPLNIKGITKVHIKSFLKYLLDEHRKPDGKVLKDSVINAYYRCLHAFFEWAVEECIIEYSPMEHMHPPAFTRPEIKPFSRRDIDDLLELCQGNKFLEIRNRALILVFFDTGLRRAELAGLMKENIDMESGNINVAFGKGKKHRIVRIGITARKALMRYLRYRNPQYNNLWQTEERKPLTYWGIYLTIKHLCERAEITDARGSPHTFRHSAAMFSLRNGAQLVDIQKMLGHSKIKTTADTYLASFDSEMAAQRHEKFSPVDNLFK